MRKIFTTFISLVFVFTAVTAGLSPTAVQAETKEGKVYNRVTLNKEKKEKYKEGEALVLFETGISLGNKKAKADAALEGNYQIEDLWSFKEKQPKSNLKKASDTGVSIALVKSKTLTTVQLIKELKKNKNVKTAEPNYRIYATSATNDKYIGSQWGIENTGQNAGTPGADTKVKSLWDKGTKGSENVIAIVDSGVDYNHEDLKDNMWNNPYEPNLKGRYGFDFINGDDDPMDDNGHGSHCAGIAGGKGNNGIGITGVNQNAKIMALKILDESGSGYGSEQVGAYQYISKAMDMGVKVRAINNSWGGGVSSEIFEKLFNIVGAKGAISVCAAGNDGFEYEGWMPAPAGVESPYKIVVAASNETNKLAGFSAYGKDSVDLAAPGTGILSTVSYDCYNPSIYSKDEVKNLSSKFTDYEASSEEEIKWGIPEAATVSPAGTKASIGLDGDKYFGNTVGKSLQIKLSDMKAGDFATVRIPYTISGLRDLDNIPSISTMVRAQAPKTDDSAVDDVENAVLFFDAPRGKTAKSFEEALWNFDAVGFYIDDAEPSWDHLTMPIYASKEQVTQERDMVFGISCQSDGDYVLNIDDVGVSKENTDTSKFGKYEFMSGTSMAAPHVTGAVALLGAANPTMNTDELIGKTVSSVKKVPDLAGKVATEGVLDFSQLGIGVPRLKDVTVNTSKKQIQLKGSGFDQATTVEINKQKATILSCKSSEIVIKDENWINTYADLKVSNAQGTAQKEGVYLVKGKKEYTATQDMNTSMNALTTDGTLIYGTNSSEDTIFKYNTAKKGEEAISPLAAINGEKLMKMKGTVNSPLDFQFGPDLVYIDGKLYNIAAMGQSIDKPSEDDFFFFFGDDMMDEEESSDPVAYTADYRLISVDTQSKKKDTALNLGAMPKDMKKVANSTIAAFNGKLYVIGGFDYANRVLSTKVKVYDPTTKKWSNGPKLPEGRAAGKVLQVGNKLVYTLGYTTEKTCPVNLVLSNGKWKKTAAIIETLEKEPTIISGEKYYLFESAVGLCAGGLVYNNMETKSLGDTFTYQISADKFVPSPYQFSSDAYRSASLKGLTIGSSFYGIKSKQVYKMPVSSGFVTVSAPKMTGGTIEGTNKPIVPGTKVTLKAVPKKGYVLKSFKVNSKKVKGSSKVIRPTTNAKASAVFVKRSK